MEILEGVWAEDIERDQMINVQNPDTLFVAASVAKLYIAAATLSLVERGATGPVDLDSRLKISLAEYQAGNYGTGVIKRMYSIPYILTKYTDHDHLPSLTLEELLMYSIFYSDNIATLKVANTIGRERIQAAVHDWGLEQTTITNDQIGTKNYTTARDMGRFLKLLARGEIILDENLKIRLLNCLPNRKLPNHGYGKTKVSFKDGRVLENRYHFSHSVGYMMAKRRSQTFTILTRADKNPDAVASQQADIEDITRFFAYMID